MSISQQSGDIESLTHPPNQVDIYQMFIQEHYIIHPMHSREIK